MTNVWSFDRVVLAVIASLAAACVVQSDEVSPDGEFDEGVSVGKADGTAFSDCELEQVVAWLNDPATTVDVLLAAGVHSRAALNLVEYRDVLDSDHSFGTIQEVDAVSYVGPVAMQQLVAAVTARCAGRGNQIEVVFSPRPYAESHLARIAQAIDGAALSLDIAMYSYRDSNIDAAVGRAIARGVRVRMIFEDASAERRDPEGTTSARLEAMGVDVRWINKIMHHKFVIIDGPQTSAEQAQTAVLITGSANWSNSAATRYDENTSFIRGNAEALLRFQREFNLLWENSRELAWNPSLQYFETLPIDDGMILDDPAIDAVFTSANFTVTQSATNGPTFSAVTGSDAVADRLVELIWSAQRSIHIASGHLRSRPVSEALLARHQADPSLDIRIYLDNQEYLSESTHQEQERDLEACLAAAGGREAARQDCMDRGFLFSYAMHLAGIQLRYKAYCYRWHYSYAEQMHHKYMVIDGRILASGSYNLSDNAEHNTMENMVIYDGAAFPDLVAAFEQNFETMWNTGVEDGLFESLMDTVQNTTNDVPLVFAPMALTWDQVTTLKTAIRDACPAVNTEDYRNHPESHRVCDR
jgi:phosphatidylserine/phosphatidylglycerophosphate/cardiolipin synthase-like enzyme